MPVAEHNAERLVLKSGSATLTLSKEVGKAILQRKVLFWSLKRIEVPLTEITDARIDASVDRASGVEFYSVMVVMRVGSAWALTATDERTPKAVPALFADFWEYRHDSPGLRHDGVGHQGVVHDHSSMARASLRGGHFSTRELTPIGGLSMTEVVFGAVIFVASLALLWVSRPIDGKMRPFLGNGVEVLVAIAITLGVGVGIAIMIMGIA
jgi:hypothetical protein